MASGKKSSRQAKAKRIIEERQRIWKRAERGDPDAWLYLAKKHLDMKE